jgi:succinylglutamic semialdehyde dehydrogenase
MVQYRFQAQVLGDYFAGQFKKPVESHGEWVSRSPASFSDELGRFSYSYAHVDEAVQSARGALSAWRKLESKQRAEFLKRFQDALKKREDQWVEAIAREVGKPFWEAKTELAAMTNKVDITIQESMKLVSDFEIPRILENTKGACRFRPLGVVAVIGPFNFPGHLPNGHIVPALLTGNTVVFKPSEKAAWVGQLMAESFQDAGLPPGVFNMVQGEREVSRRLCAHEGVNGVLFTGSYEVGVQIKQDTLHQHWKLLALEMGGKNSVIIWKDADLEVAVYESLLGSFLTAGQRCSATSRILVHRDLLSPFVGRFHERAKAFKIGHPLDNPFMGPLIDQGSVDRLMKFQGISAREGFEPVMSGKVLDLHHRGHYVTPSISLMARANLDHTRKSIYQQTELFAPNVAILGVDDLGEAVAQANATQFGLAASVFTKSKAVYESCLDELEVGLVNWNKATVGASSRLPFGGLKKSGNHFPTALSAPLYCTSPVASLEVSEPQSVSESASKNPGLNWNL